MKKIVINKINENIYYEKLNNGLKVYLYANENMHNNYATFTTKYGSIYSEFKLDNEDVKAPHGVAHFLEHKVFVQENDPQPEAYFAINGSSCNAWTTYENTTYLFMGTDNVISNVKFLLDFVQNVYLTDENVESEKGIITQEINMCKDRPLDILADNIKKCTLKYSPFKDSITGEVEDINNITRDILLKCYNSFYHPENMFLIVCGNFDPSEMIEAIKENQSNKTFSEFKKPKLKKVKEPDSVILDKKVIKLNTNIPKMAYSLKIPKKNFNVDKRKINIYLFLLFNILFSETSKFDEKMKTNGVITSTIGYELMDVQSHLIISLINSGERYEELIEEIDKTLKNIKIDKNEFERKKKVLISNEIFAYESVYTIDDMIMDNIMIDGKIDNDIVNTLNSLKLEELNEIIDKIDFNNKNIIILEKEDKCN